MQTIFGLHTAREAEYNITRESVKDKFLPDLNSMEEQDKEQLAKDRKTAGLYFDHVYKNGQDASFPDLSPQIKAAVSNGLDDYKRQIQNLRLTYKKRMVADTKKIFDQYLSLLQLGIELQHVVKSILKRNETSNFQNNRVIEALKNSAELASLVIKKNVSWQDDPTIVRGWVKDIIKKDDTFIEYEGAESPSLEEDLNIVVYLYKSLLFKNETIKAHFESMDLGWSENSSVLKSMVLKTVKSVDSEDAAPILMELSKNWEEDLLFLEDIFDYTLSNEEEYREIVAEKSKNWEIDRVAMTDKIILEMALAEMINFASIPVKVTINEYIELSKLYSTPKSKQFINGILDVLSEELKKEGKIKKSGRGLLDNK